MMRWIIFVMVFLFFAPDIQAQKQGRAYVDSLVKALPAIKVDTDQARLIDTISLLYNTINPDTGIKYGNRGLALSQKINWKRGIAKAYNGLGANSKAKTENAIALDYYYKALAIFEELKDDRSVEAEYGNIGNVYLAQRSFGNADYYDSAALHYDSIALGICFKIHDTAEIVRHLGNIGVIYDEKKDYKNAKNYYFKALTLARKNDYKKHIASNLGSIAGIYLSQDSAAEDSLKKAIVYGQQCIELYKELGDQLGLVINTGNLGAIYLGIAKLHKDKSEVALKNSNLEHAILFLKTSVDASEKIGFLDGLYQCYQMLSEAYTLKGDVKNSYDYYKQYVIIKDSINKNSSNENIANLETKRALDLKQKDIVIQTNQLQIEELKKLNQRKTNILFIAGIVILLGIMVVVIRKFLHSMKSNRQLALERKKHIERIRAQKTVLKDIAYIQSHEVRGPLSTIMGLVDLFNYEDPADPNNIELLEGIASVTKRLDKVVTEVVNKENVIYKDESMDQDEVVE